MGQEQEGAIVSTGGQGYALFAFAEQKNVTVTRLLIGREMPLLNLEWVLLNTYGLAKQRLKQQQERKTGKRR